MRTNHFFRNIYLTAYKCSSLVFRKKMKAMNTITRSVIYLFLSTVLLSCEKNVTVKVPEASEEIVVEGRIETGLNPIVLLTKTLPFFGEISTSEIFQNTVLGATVIVSNGSTIDTLTQIPNIGVYTTSGITGIPGETYNLTVIAQGKTLHSVTTIPYPVKLDSVWWKPDGNRDSLGFAWAHLTDPDTIGNNYQWAARRINKYKFGPDKGKVKDSIFIAAPGGSFEDKFINSKSFDFSFPRGRFSFSDKDDDNNDERFFFKRGDTIIVKFSSIDRANFEFWRSEDTQVQNNGNPFGSPAPIQSNIEGGLGTWGGFAPSFDTIIAR